MKMLFFICFLFTPIYNIANTVMLNYYGTTIELSYDENINNKCIRLKANSYSLNKFYDTYKKTRHIKLLRSFQKQKEELNLNDWMYYKLIEKTINVIYPKSRQLNKDAIVWFYLFESNYDITVLFDNKEIFLYAAINSFLAKKTESYCADVLVKGKRKFTIINKAKRPSELLYFGSKQNKEGELFKIEAKQLPKLKSQIIKKKVNFYLSEKKYKIEYFLDTTMIAIYRNAPAGCLGESFDVPLTKTTYNSLIPQLKELIKGKTEVEASRFLLSFVRGTFKHKDDREIYGREKYMTPEEALYYEYSDCEDRSALYYYLVKELLNIPMTIISYPSHCSIATNFDSLEIDTKKSFEYNGKNYWFTEPTDFYNTLEIGSPYSYMKDDEFRIVKEYIPMK